LPPILPSKNVPEKLSVKTIYFKITIHRQVPLAFHLLFMIREKEMEVNNPGHFHKNRQGFHLDS